MFSEKKNYTNERHNPGHDCAVVGRVQEIEKDLNELRKQNSQTHERVFDRLGVLEKQDIIQGEQFKNIMDKLTNLTTSVTEIKNDSKEVIMKLPPITQRIETLEKMTDDVDELKEKPGKQWESVSGQIIGLIVAAVVGFILSRIGL